MPRMWMVDPARMCRKHLVAEHHECHVFLGRFVKGLKVDGYVKSNLLEPEALVERHDALVAEMQARGYGHSSPMSAVDVADVIRWHPLRWATIDRTAAKAELVSRCPDCANNFRESADGALHPIPDARI